MNQVETIDLSPHRRKTNVLVVSDTRLESLIGACAIGTESAFEQLYRLTSSQLFGVLRRILKTDALAEEALQDTYVKIWNQADSYESEKSAPRTWLVSIARYHAIDLLRQRRSWHDVDVNLDSVGMNTMPGMDAVPGCEKAMDLRRESSQILNLCLQDQTESARECLIRAYCEGLSREELSARLLRPVVTVKSWIRRGLISLKDCIDGYA